MRVAFAGRVRFRGERSDQRQNVEKVMKLDLSEILCHVGMRLATDIDEPPIVDEYIECASRVVGDITFNNTGSILLASGEVNTSVVLACSRCLVYYQEPVQLQIDEQFALAPTGSGPRRKQMLTVVEDDENPDAAHLFEGPLFDLTEALRQALSLALPIRPLHAEDCLGLCSRCGHDLNQGPCKCDPEPIEKPLGPLAALLQNMETKS
jgi:uncharacterized protein